MGPDIAYAVNCAAMYMFCPKYFHELELNIIGRYLRGTRDRGLVLNPSSELRIDFYPDTVFLEFMCVRRPLTQHV